MSRIRLTLASLAVCGLVAAIAVPLASAKTQTFHFFSKTVYSRLSDAKGHPLGPKATPVAGDRLSSGSNDYVGNHKQHAKRATASDRISCTVNGKTTALCDGTIAIGGSMLFGDNFVISFVSSKPQTIKITGGTGRYRHAHGTVHVQSVGNNANDLTIKVS